MKFGRSFLGASERSLQFVLNLFRNTCSTWRESSILLDFGKVLLVGPHDTSELRHANPIASDDTRHPECRDNFSSSDFFFLMRIAFLVYRTLGRLWKSWRKSWITDESRKQARKSMTMTSFVGVRSESCCDSCGKGERATRGGWTLGKLPYWRDSRWHVKVVILFLTNDAKW